MIRYYSNVNVEKEALEKGQTGKIYQEQGRIIRMATSQYHKANDDTSNQLPYPSIAMEGSPNLKTRMH